MPAPEEYFEFSFSHPFYRSALREEVMQAACQNKLSQKTLAKISLTPCSDTTWQNVAQLDLAPRSSASYPSGYSTAARTSPRPTDFDSCTAAAALRPAANPRNKSIYSDLARPGHSPRPSASHSIHSDSL